MTEPLASQIVVIAVPAGAVPDTPAGHEPLAPLRALIVPQLRMAPPQPGDDPTPNDELPLLDFGFADWPDVVRNAHFTVQLADGAGSDAVSHALTPVPVATDDWWRALFAGDIAVRKIRNRSYGRLDCPETTNYARRIARTYSASAQAYLPNREDTRDPATIIAEQYVHWRDETPEPTPVDPPPGGHTAVQPEEWSTPDFQRTVSMLRAHPAVLMRLGLIIEFAVPTAVIPICSAQDGRVIRIGCDFGAEIPSTVSIVTPWTQFEFNDGRFLPAPSAGSDVKRGVIDLAGAEQISAQSSGGTSDRWSLVTFDVEGAVTRLRDGAQHMGPDPAGLGKTSADASQASMPVLQSAGISLLRNGRRAVLESRLTNNAPSDANARRRRLDDAVLTAEDLTSGYNVDIMEESATTWTPLCARTARYTCRLGDRELELTEVEEAPVKANAAIIGKDAVLRTDELLFRWTGWGLAIPRPIFEQSGRRPRVRSRVDKLPFDFDFDFDFERSGPQVPLRFGKGYRVRVRIADMAGGGLTTHDLDANEGASGLVQYRRHEPVMPPEFAPLKGMFAVVQGEMLPAPDVFGPGSSMNRLIIRSDPMGDPPMNVEEFDTAIRAEQGDAAGDRCQEDRSRIVLPPPTSMVMAEQYGVLDGADAATWQLAQRAMADPAAGPDGDFNWLPDPAAIGVQAYVRPRGDSPTPGLDARTPWAPQWPAPAPKSLWVRQSDFPGQEIDWHMIDRRDTLVVVLEPGTQADVELSSTLLSGNLDMFEIRKWASGAEESQIADGRHPMVTPPRVVEFIHAVRRPMAKPNTHLTPAREEGSLFAVLADGIPDGDDAPRLFGIHRASTGQLDVRAQWNEPGDDEKPGPLVVEEVASLTVGRDDDVITNNVSPGARGAEPLQVSTFRHDFGDTRHRTVTYTLTACSRYREFFEAGSDFDFQNFKVLPPVSIPSSARPSPPVVLSVSPAFNRRIVDDDGAGRAQRIRRGKTVRIELARPWNVSGEGEQLAVVIAAEASKEYLEEAGRHVSRLYRDPIWKTAGVGGYLQRDAFLDSVGPMTCTLQETGQPVVAIPVDVFFDEDTDRWCADVELPMFTAEYLLPEPDRPYSPLVRLAVARYQRESIHGCELSRTVMTDFVSLLPDRTLFVSMSADGPVEQVHLQLNGAEPKGPQPNKVIAVVETATLPEGAFGDVSDVTSADPDHVGLWHRDGQVVIGVLNAPLAPLQVRHNTGSVRIVVREIEDIASPVAKAEDGTFAADLQQRTVFMDVVRIA